ncbi:NAD(P)-binding protein [uncultured Shewanella sp.]|uniref:NAD(P)-binding protein n=1 Tax=uncultured Shewanella sp. TaxID=173975 RepID=UPI00262CE802|nr:NAD(P)-binding protein [uncultured Shewanella sp.]
MKSLVSNNEPVTIVGGGITGLAVARFLIISGHLPEKIIVIEKNHRWGGHTRTLYLYLDRYGSPRMISDYSIDLENLERPLLIPSLLTPEFLSLFPAGVAELNDPRILPIDAGFCISTPSYQNYARLLNQDVPYPRVDVSLKSHIKRGYLLKNNIFLDPSLPLFGLWRQVFRFIPQIPQLIDFKKQMNSFLDSIKDENLTTMTVSEFFSQRRLNGTMFGDFITAMVALYSGYTEAHLRCASAQYFIDFLLVMNMPRGFSGINTALLGNSLSIQTLVNNLQRSGVKMFTNTRYNAAIHNSKTVFAIHPWENNKLKDIHLESLLVPVYVSPMRCEHLLGMDSLYTCTPELSHVTHVIGSYRPNFPCHNVQITFGVTGQEKIYEAIIRRDANATGIPLKIIPLESYKGEPLDQNAVKTTWKHAYVTPEFELAREKIHERQGLEGHWFASASLLRSARHEDGVTSGLEAVVLMKGATALKKLSEMGFKMVDTSRSR